MDDSISFIINHIPEAYKHLIIDFLFFIGLFRTVLMPILTIIDFIIKKTKSKKDDILEEKIKASHSYKIIAWVLYYLTSVKLPKRH